MEQEELLFIQLAGYVCSIVFHRALLFVQNPNTTLFFRGNIHVMKWTLIESVMTLVTFLYWPTGHSKAAGRC